MLALIWRGLSAPLIALTDEALAAAWEAPGAMVPARAEARVKRMADPRMALRGSSPRRRHKFDDEA
jgi:hypothetical protein